MDRAGERVVLLGGLAATALVGVLAILSTGVVQLALTLFVAGLAAACTGSASGRVVVGWFPPHRRGLAMGIRQTAQPVGVGIAAVTMALVADRFDADAALWVPVVACAVAAAVVGGRGRPSAAGGRRRRGRQPLPRRPVLPRVHAVSVLLVVPQFVGLDLRPGVAGAGPRLVTGRRGQRSSAIAQVAGVARPDRRPASCPTWSGARMRPLRWVTWAALATMLALGGAAGLDWASRSSLVVVATMVTVADNGLAYTAVAERAGPFWSGRALGLQNTAQYLTAAAVPPLAALAVTHGSYALTFALAAAFPLAALALVPVRDERAFSQ